MSATRGLQHGAERQERLMSLFNSAIAVVVASSCFFFLRVASTCVASCKLLVTTVVGSCETMRRQLSIVELIAFIAL